MAHAAARKNAAAAVGRRSAVGFELIARLRDAAAFVGDAATAADSPVGAIAAVATLLGVVCAVAAVMLTRPPDAPSQAQVAGGDAGGEGGFGDSGDAAATTADFPARMESARPVLRLGANSVRTLFGGGLSPALFWGVVEPGPEEGSTVPVLVEEEPTLENGGARPRDGGGLVVTWRFRPGLRWSDGTPFHASDAAFCLTTFRSEHLISATATDARTLVAEWDDRHAHAFRAFNPYPAKLLGPVRESEGSDAVLQKLRTTPMPVMGPYRVESFEPGERLVVVANPHHPGPPPAIGRLELIQGNADELARMFEAGEIDGIFPNHLSLEQARELRERQPLAVHIRPSAIMVTLQPDRSVPLLTRREVRRAILQAIDRDAFADTIYGPTAEVAHAPVMGELPRGAVRHGHDLRAAREALAAAGAAGQEITLVFQDSATNQRAAELVAANLEAAGLTVRRRAIDAMERSAASRTGDHGGLLFRALRITRGRHALTHWNVPVVDGRYATERRTEAFDDVVASLIEREERAMHDDRRRQLRDELVVAFTERLPTLPITFTTERVVMHPDLRGWDRDPREIFGRAIETWYFVAPSR